MSQQALFNALKYPISYPPTVEELEAIPRSLFRLWLKENWRLENVAKITPQDVVEIIKMYRKGHLINLEVFDDKLSKSIQCLRDAIKLL